MKRKINKQQLCRNQKCWDALVVTKEYYQKEMDAINGELYEAKRLAEMRKNFIQVAFDQRDAAAKIIVEMQKEIDALKKL